MSMRTKTTQIDHKGLFDSLLSFAINKNGKEALQYCSVLRWKQLGRLVVGKQSAPTSTEFNQLYLISWLFAF